MRPLTIQPVVLLAVVISIATCAQAQQTATYFSTNKPISNVALYNDSVAVVMYGGPIIRNFYKAPHRLDIRLDNGGRGSLQTRRNNVYSVLAFDQDQGSYATYGEEVDCDAVGQSYVLSDLGPRSSIIFGQREADPDFYPSREFSRLGIKMAASTENRIFLEAADGIAIGDRVDLGSPFFQSLSVGLFAGYRFDSRVVGTRDTFYYGLMDTLRSFPATGDIVETQIPSEILGVVSLSPGEVICMTRDGVYEVLDQRITLSYSFAEGISVTSLTADPLTGSYLFVYTYDESTFFLGGGTPTGRLPDSTRVTESSVVKSLRSYTDPVSGTDVFTTVYQGETDISSFVVSGPSLESFVQLDQRRVNLMDVIVEADSVEYNAASDDYSGSWRVKPRIENYGDVTVDAVRLTNWVGSWPCYEFVDTTYRGLNLQPGEQIDLPPFTIESRLSLDRSTYQFSIDMADDRPIDPSAQKTVTYQPVLSSINRVKPLKLNAYPTIVDDVITIEFPADKVIVTCYVIDALGRQQALQMDDSRLDVTQLKAGTYICSLKFSDGTRGVVRFMKGGS